MISLSVKRLKHKKTIQGGEDGQIKAGDGVAEKESGGVSRGLPGAPRGLPGSYQGAPRGLPGGSQGAPREVLGGSQGSPSGLPGSFQGFIRVSKMLLPLLLSRGCEYIDAPITLRQWPDQGALFNVLLLWALHIGWGLS